MPDEQPTAAGPRPFTGFLQEQRRGALHHELSDGLAELVAACMEHGKAGKLVLTLNVRPADDQMVQISDVVKLTKPEGEKGHSLFYTAEDGSVTRTDPKQPELPLGVAPMRGRAVSE